MPRPRPVAKRLASLLLILSSGLCASADTPPAPWASKPAGEADVAAWANDALAPPASEPAPAPLPPLEPLSPKQAEPLPPAVDPFAGSARHVSPSARPKPEPLPKDNPLRSAGPATIRFDATPSDRTSDAARAAFDHPGAAGSARPIPVGAAPIGRPSPEVIHADAPTTPSRLASRARVTPVAGLREPAPAPSVTPAATAMPVRSVSSEGVGRPGPTTLEGPQRASLVLEKRAPSEVRLGQPATFATRVRNTGDAPAQNVVLTDPIPAGARFVGATPNARIEGGRLVWRLGTIGPGEERIVETRLEPTREGPLGSVATVTMDTAASVATHCTRPALALRVATERRAPIGEQHQVTIEVHNPGTGTATGVMLVADLPPQVSHPAGRELEFEVGALAAGETRRIDLGLTAQAAGRVATAMRVVGEGGLTAEGRLDFEVIAPSLAVSVSGPTRRYLERPASYTIGVDNPGTAPARDVRLVTHLPRGLKFVRANNLGEYDEATHSVYWSLAELPEGERGEVQVVAMPVTAGDHTLTVEGESADGLHAKDAHRVAVDGIAALAFEVRDLSDPIGVGDETVYEVRVHNEGTKAATGVRVLVEAAPGMRLLAAEGRTPARTSGDRAEFAPLGTLQPGEKAAYRVRAAGATPGDQRVTVLVSSDDLDRPIRREESTRVFGDE